MYVQYTGKTCTLHRQDVCTVHRKRLVHCTGKMFVCCTGKILYSAQARCLYSTQARLVRCNNSAQAWRWEQEYKGRSLLQRLCSQIGTLDTHRERSGLQIYKMFAEPCIGLTATYVSISCIILLPEKNRTLPIHPQVLPSVTGESRSLGSTVRE